MHPDYICLAIYWVSDKTRPVWMQQLLQVECLPLQAGLFALPVVEQQLRRGAQQQKYALLLWVQHLGLPVMMADT